MAQDYIKQLFEANRIAEAYQAIESETREVMAIFDAMDRSPLKCTAEERTQMTRFWTQRAQQLQQWIVQYVQGETNV